MNSYNLLSIKTCNFLLLSFKTVVTRKIWEIYEVKDFALSMRKFSANAILKHFKLYGFCDHRKFCFSSSDSDFKLCEFTQTLAQRNATQRNATHVSYCNSRKVLATQEELSQACESHLT